MKLSKKNLKITKKTLFSFRSKSLSLTETITFTGDPTATLITTVNQTRP